MVAFSSSPTGSNDGSEIESDAGVLRLLIRKVRLGLVLSGIWFWATLVAAILAFHEIHSVPWTVALAIASMTGGFVHYSARQKIGIARHVVLHPEIVFWVHSTMWRRRYETKIVDVPFITLHLRSGQTYEVAMSEDEIRRIAEWLRGRNPTVRIGAYETDEGSGAGPIT